jgi:pSer/pThr/pTyr-binding forkhead associated (FHA) protein
MKLKLTNVDQHKPPVVLDQFPVIVGLDPGADLCLDDSSVGHYQCMIDHSDGELMVWDLGTKAGTFINGHRVSPKAPLRPGDELAFGKSRFTVHYDDGSRPSTPDRRPRRQKAPLPC